MAIDVTEEQDEEVDVQFQFEVSDEPLEETKEPAKGTDQTSTRLAELERENRDLRDNFSKMGGQKELVESLSLALGGQKKPDIDPKSLKSFDQELAEIKDDLLDNPDKALKKYGELLIKHEIGPAFGALSSELASMRNELDQKNMGTDPVFKDVLDNYKDEVEKVRSTLQAQGVRDALKQAVNQVSVGHMTEIIERRVQAQSRGPEPEGTVGPGIDTQGRKTQTKIVRLTTGEEQERLALGLGYEDYISVRRK